MSDLNVHLRLTADGKVLSAETRKAADEVGGIGKASEEAAQKSERAAERTARALGAVKAVALAASAAAVTAGAAIVAGIRSSINAMDDMSKSAQKVGVTTEELSRLRYAAELSGIATTELQVGMKALIDNMSDAPDKFAAIGVATQDANGKLRSASDVIGDVAEHFADLPDGAAKSKLAVDLFGRSGLEMIPMLNAGRDGLEAMGDEAERLGLVFNTQASKQAEQFNDNLTRLQGGMKGVFNTLAVEVLPTLVEYSDQLIEAVKDGDAVAKGATSIRVAFQLLVAVGVTVSNVFQAIGKVIGGTLAIVGTVVSGTISALQKAAGAMQSYWDALLDLDFKRARDSLASGFRSVVSETESSLRQISQIRADTFTDLVADVNDVAAAWGKVGDPATTAAAATAAAGVAAGKAAPKVRELSKEGDGLASAAGRAGEKTDAWALSIGRLLDQVENSAVDRTAADMAQLAIALDVALSEGNIEAATRIREALVQLSEAGIKPASEGMREFGDESTRANELAIRAAEDSARAWTDFAGNLVSAMRRGMRGVKDLFKGMLQDLARQLLQSTVLRLMSGFFGGSVPGLAVAAGTGGPLSMLGAMFGGGAAGASAGTGGIGGLLGAVSGANSLFSMIGSGIGGGIFNLGTSLFGSSIGAVSNFGGGLATAGANILGGGGFFGSLGANLSGGFGSLFGGNIMAGLGQLAGVLGPIAAVAGIVDAVSGGRLFGTSYKPESAARQIDIGAGGASGFESVTESRRRSLFRGTQRRTTTSALDDDVQTQIDSLFAAVQAGMVAAARALGGDVPALIAGSFRQEFDAKGNLTREFSQIAGRIYEESQEAFGRRLLAENLIATIDAALGGVSQQVGEAIGEAIIGGNGGPGLGDQIGELIGSVMPKDVVARAVGEASAIAERWRGNADALLDGAQFLLAAATDLRRGVGLLGDGSLTEIVDLIEDMARSGESLVDAYARIAGATALLEEALDLSGVSLDRSREEFVRFASEIADAAGGLDRAGQLWSRYFQTFLSAEERAALSLSRAQGAADREFGDIGLSAADFTGEGGLAAFRQLFNEALPTLSAQAVVEWLEAADALGLLNEAQAAYNATLGEGVRDAQAVAEILAELKWDEALAGMSALDRELAESARRYADAESAAAAAGATEEELAQIRELGARAAARISEAAAAEALQELAEATERYNGLVRDLQDELDDATLSPFQRQVRDIVRWADASRSALNDAARAAGQASAAERDLDLVRQVATQRLAEAVRQLRESARGLVEQLQGSRLQQLDSQIAAAESSRGQLDAIGEADRAAQDYWRRQRQAIDGIRAWLDQQLLGELSTLTPEQRLAEAQRQFDALASAAAGGDAEALAQLPRAAEALLREGRDFWASSEPYTQLEAAIRASMQQLLGLDIGSEPAAGGRTEVTASPELQALYAERDRLLAELEESNRRALAEQIAVMMRDLIAGTGDSLGEVAASIGVNMAGLVADLGINLGQLNADTATALAGVARTLGVDLADLAAEVGVDLGGLGDRQSLLNQALDQTLAGVPEDIRERLLGPLDALRSAVTETDISDAMASLLGVTDDLPAGIRDLLAPFFSEIDPTPLITELGTLRDLYDLGGQQLAEAVAQTSYLQAIVSALGAANSAAGIPGYEVGTGYVPNTGPALLHRGEMVLPAPVAEFFRREGIPQSGGGVPDVAAELRAMRREQAEQAREMREAMRRLEAAELRAGEQISDEFRRAADAARAIR